MKRRAPPEPGGKHSARGGAREQSSNPPAKSVARRIGLDGYQDNPIAERLRSRLHQTDLDPALELIERKGEPSFLRIVEAAHTRRERSRPNLVDMNALKRAMYLYLTVPDIARAEAARRAAREAELSGMRGAGPYASEKGLRDALRCQFARVKFPLWIRVSADVVRNGDRLCRGAHLQKPLDSRAATRLAEEQAATHFCRALAGRVPEDLLMDEVLAAFEGMVASLNQPKAPAALHAPTLAAPLPTRELRAVEDGSAMHLRAALRDQVDPSLPLGAVLDAFDAAVAWLNQPRQTGEAEK